MTAAETTVLDASALGKRLAEEQHTAAFNAWHDKFLAGGGRAVAPHILRYELGNLLTKKARTDSLLTPERRERLLEVTLLGLQFAEGSGTEGFAPPLSYYDAAYVALARSLKATLVTYDDKMVAAAKKAKVRVLSPGA